VIYVKNDKKQNRKTDILGELNKESEFRHKVLLFLLKINIFLTSFLLKHSREKSCKYNLDLKKLEGLHGDRSI